MLFYDMLICTSFHSLGCKSVVMGECICVDRLKTKGWGRSLRCLHSELPRKESSSHLRLCHIYIQNIYISAFYASICICISGYTLFSYQLLWWEIPKKVGFLSTSFALLCSTLVLLSSWLNLQNFLTYILVSQLFSKTRYLLNKALHLVCSLATLILRLCYFYVGS